MKKRRTASSRPAAAVQAASARTPGYDDLLAIVRLIESGSRFSEFRLRSGDIEVEIRRANGAPGPAEPPLARQPAAVLSAPPPTASPVAAAPALRPAVEALELPAGAHVVRAPMVGTFYRAPEPGAPPFVEPGTRVAPDTVVCIIEVMKLMNSVPAGVSGVVTHVLVDNASMVEYGQPMIAIRPEP